MRLGRTGEAGHAKDSYIPDRAELETEIDELIASVHGAVRARLQLGFENVAEEEWNLRPIIKDLQVKLASHTKPLINKQAGTAGKPEISSAAQLAIPARAPGKSPGNHSSSSKALLDPLTYNMTARTRSVGSQDVESAARTKKEQAEAFVRKLKKEKTERERQVKLLTEAKD